MATIIIMLPLDLLCLLIGYNQIMNNIVFEQFELWGMPDLMFYYESPALYFIVVYPVLFILTLCFIRGCYLIPKDYFRASMYFAVPMFSLFFICLWAIFRNM
ncbi:MAG: hypothetical protein LBU87_04955 [Lactobacillales bacterium]|nr:hypothetical protein [Lactobacillales bacterium]